MLTVRNVNERVNHIRELASTDPEAAHAEEDSLHYDVLKAIADVNVDDPVTAAHVAITTQEIQFSRWCG